MDWILWSAWLALGLGGIALLGWCLTCLREGEFRALGFSLLLALPPLLAWTALLLVPFAGRSWLVVSLLGALVLFLILLSTPFGNGPAGSRVVGTIEQVDERDAVFHRFYRLEEGSPEFQEYYTDHPELLDSDRKLKQKPGLGSPGSKNYHPLNSVYQDALSQVSEGLAAHGHKNQGEPAGEPVKLSPGAARNRLQGLARHLGADLVACTKLEPSDIYSHVARGSGEWGSPIKLKHGYALVIAIAMDWDLVRLAPGSGALTETAACYARLALIAQSVAATIGRWGYHALAHQDTDYKVMCGPLAERAGLGETGRNGLFIAPRFGPRVRLAVVSTDLPLAVHSSGPPRLGVQDFCSICLKCADNCPSKAVDNGPAALHNGVLKWQTDREACYRLWRQYGTDCGLCIRSCPFAKPDSWSHQVVRWFIARNALSRRLALWADDLLYGRKMRSGRRPPDWHED